GMGSDSVVAVVVARNPVVPEHEQRAQYSKNPCLSPSPVWHTMGHRGETFSPGLSKTGASVT
ncbi:Hypothetical predicted protein, partial [Pelobates cultripes]